MYLYGASVQGIQDFIFKTNKLQEIVGASEIVKHIENLFEENYVTQELILNAAGNIKAVMEEKDCQKVVMEFPQKVMLMAYGITISQAVVKIAGESATQEEINQLEQHLKIQRNRVSVPLDLSLNIMELTSSTAKPVVAYAKIKNKSTPIDRATKQKLKANDDFFKNNRELREFKNLSELSNGKNKIAVVHADGNGLGMLIPKLHEQGKKLSDFSKALDEATKEAFNRAKDDTMSIRDVILGGDDMVVICNANDALTFTHNFLKYFEEESQSKLGSKLTACAGIAYSNEKYPFHYAVNLAEELCSQTKKRAKEINADLAPSSLMFHNIQSSNFHSWDKFVEDELTIENDEYNGDATKSLDKKGGIRCDFGPYYLEEESQPLIQDFIHTVEAYRCEGSPISRLRAWIGELSHSSESARLMLERINTIVEQKGEWHSSIMQKNLNRFNEKLNNETLVILKDNLLDNNNKPIILQNGENKKYYKTPIYDVLQILSATEVK